MIRVLLVFVLLGLAACATGQTTTALSTPSGQLFCAFEMAGGGTIVAGLVNAEASAAAPGAAPVAILATNAAKAVVDADCAAAAANLAGATAGAPVSPPAAPAAAPQVAVTPAKP